MDARNRSIPDWFDRIRTGQVLLPRFQRHLAWAHGEVGALLEAVLRSLPAGAVLVLEVGNDQPFESRTMVGAPEPVERCTEHLLDGQQRLTALWRSLNDDYEDRTWLIGNEVDEESGAVRTTVVGQARYWRNGDQYPRWVDDPVQLWARRFIPARLLRPGDIQQEIRTWADAATENDLASSRDLENEIGRLRVLISTYNIPYLSLPTTTPRDVALDVFIKLNTSSVPLTAYDIVVAQLEAKTGQPLHDMVASLVSAAPSAEIYRDPGNWALDVASLREDHSPTQASYLKLQPSSFNEHWELIVAGVDWTTRFIEDEKVFDALRLPTVAVLPILAALYDSLPTQPDQLGRARTILRAYTWRSFLTRRYEQSVGSRSLQDFRGLRTALAKDLAVDDLASIVPIFDEDEYPLPTTESLQQARWPRYKDILGRGVLAVSLRAGGHDLADGAPASRESVKHREYHHLFPDSIITGDAAGLPSSRSYRALNCALITWRTNRTIAAREPIAYLRDRMDGAGGLGEQVIRDRLRTHLVPYEELSVGWSHLTDAEDHGEVIRSDYEHFLEARARLVLGPALELCNGMIPTS
jgi:hypothetical protein